MHSFSDRIKIIGINPYVSVPADVLQAIFDAAGKTKGPIPVRGTLNGKKFLQTLVKYKGAWRLYLNTPMRRAAGIDVGDMANVRIAFNAKPRPTLMPPALAAALSEYPKAKVAFDALTPSHCKEIMRYIGFLKTEKSVQRNIQKVLQHLTGKKTKGIYALMWRKHDKKNT